MRVPTPGSGSLPSHAVADEEASGGRTVRQYLKDVGLFFAAPFITLAYLALFPFIALKLLVRSRRDRRMDRSLRAH